MITVHDIQIDTDDRGYELHLSTDEGDFHFNIHMVALELEAIVRKELRPYALEAEHARQAVAAGVTLDEYVGRPPSDEPWPFDPDLVRDIGRSK